MNIISTIEQHTKQQACNTWKLVKNGWSSTSDNRIFMSNINRFYDWRYSNNEDDEDERRRGRKKVRKRNEGGGGGFWKETGKQ